MYLKNDNNNNLKKKKIQHKRIKLHCIPKI